MSTAHTQNLQVTKLLVTNVKHNNVRPVPTPISCIPTEESEKKKTVSHLSSSVVWLAN